MVGAAIQLLQNSVTQAHKQKSHTKDFSISASNMPVKDLKDTAAVWNAKDFP